MIPALVADVGRLRIRGEYLEMPGLRLTPAQTRRLFGLDPDVCEALLATLVQEGFLRRAPDGTYCRAT
jgi:DNA-binding IclR family transcriptional regulator